VWHGKVPHSKVQELMANADLFFFTSVAEGTPHVVLEAISNNLPVLCFNTCGQGDSVNEKVGFKIELSNPGHSQNEFAAAIRLFYTDRNLLADMSQNCAVRKEELSWDNKARQMLEVYNATS
jgi:glycosyltransferase involved in cell wall biosynthesis